MKTITLTDEQYEKLVDVLGDHSDKGPRDYGWNSKELDELISVVNYETSQSIDTGFTDAAMELQVTNKDIPKHKPRYKMNNTRFFIKRQEEGDS